MIKKISFYLAIVTVIFLSACSSLISVSPSTTPITEKDTFTKLKYASGKSYGYQIAGIPFFPSNPSKEATENAVKNGGGNGLIEVTEESNAFYLFVVNVFWTKVEGTAVKIEHKGMEVE